MTVERATLVVVFLSGGLAGLAGAIELLGVVGRLQGGITGPNYGYIAIVATLIAGHRMRFLPLTALFLGGLLAANVALQVSIGGGSELLIIGLVMLSVLVLNR
jgi:simple sugar transport system permease protein